MPLFTRVGSFQKTTSTGAQAITGVGFKPKALIVWTSGSTVDATGGGSSDTSTNRWSMGISSGASETYCMSGATRNGVSPTATGRGLRAKLISLEAYTGTTPPLAECDLGSFDSDGFTINWTTNNSEASYISYLALGGPDLTNAKAITWSHSGSTGNQTVSTVGFQPDLVFHASGSGVGAPPQSATVFFQNTGFMDSSGNQFAFSGRSNNGVATTGTSLVWRTDRAISGVNSTGNAESGPAYSYNAMTANGFTVNHAIADTRNSISLALKGGNMKVGSFSRAGSPSTSDSVNVGFKPNSILFSGAGVTASGLSTNNRMYFGGYDGNHNASSLLIDIHGTSAAGLNAFCRYRTDTPLEMISHTGANLGQITSTSLTSTGFTVNWTNNDASARLVGYVAFGGTASKTDQFFGFFD